jgi:hypothetical protein
MSNLHEVKTEFYKVSIYVFWYYKSSEQELITIETFIWYITFFVVLFNETQYLLRYLDFSLLRSEFSVSYLHISKQFLEIM